MSRRSDAQGFHSAFRQLDEGGRVKLAKQLLRVAIEELAPLRARTPRSMSAAARKAYQDAGISLAWDLENPADATIFRLTAEDSAPNPSERSALDLLAHCWDAIESGVVTEQAKEYILLAYIGLDDEAVARDAARQAGTRQPRGGSRMPALDAWLDRTLMQAPAASDKELLRLLEHPTKPLDKALRAELRRVQKMPRGFSARCTASRKRVRAQVSN